MDSGGTGPAGPPQPPHRSLAPVDATGRREVERNVRDHVRLAADCPAPAGFDKDRPGVQAVTARRGNGVPRETGVHAHPRLTENRLRPAFTRAVDQVAERLVASAHRTDYANRRRRMARWSMGDTHWFRLFEELPGLTRMRTTADPRIASIIVWSDVTRAEAPHCPIVKMERGRGDARLLTSRTSALHEADIGRGERFRLRQRLSLYATQLAAACDQNRPLCVSVRAIVEEETRTRRTAQLR